MSKSSICYYFNSPRGCHFGANCKFLHATTSSFSANKETSIENQQDAVSVKAHRNRGVSGSYQGNSSQIQQYPTSWPTEEKTKTCFNFNKFGRCRFGESCRFLHETPIDYSSENPSAEILPSVATETDQKKTSGDGVKHQKKTFTRSYQQKSSVKTRVCEFFKAGNCRWGRNCRYLHPSSEDLIDVPSTGAADVDGEVLKNHGSGESARFYPKREPFRPPVVRKDLKRSQASEEDMAKLKVQELEQLKKRFTKNQLKDVQEDVDEKTYRIAFSSSDPDWPYDVKVFELLVKFPSNYPLQLFDISLPTDQNLPETVRRYVEVSVKEWIDKKQTDNETADRVEIAFRPFIRWLDKNLESVVTEGLKQLKRELVAQASGLQFIPASQLQQKKSDAKDAGSTDEDSEADNDSGDDTDDGPDEPLMIYRKKDDDEEEVYTGPDRDDERYLDDDKENEDLQLTTESSNLLNDEKKGTEVKLKELQLKEKASTLTINEIKITLQCGRCKNRADLLTPAGRVNQMACSKCSNMQYLIYRPVLAHQFSSVIGYLDVEGCLPFDLVLQDCPGRIGCLECSKESKIQGMVPGQLLNIWCNSCHSKLTVAAEVVKFTELQPSGVDTENTGIHVIKTKKHKIPKDPMIHEGLLLPEYGACKHYKKSYRWFRFPCCGKCYPCDICHDEKEMGHEMVFATRMICGYCCKEQPYAPEKPCISCQQMMTRGKTSHWEGGKGCRDKIKMSRNDKNKYSNQNKTVSRKTQEKTKPVGKKNDKLRHSSA